MRLNRTLAVIKKELKLQLITKAFIFSTVFIPIFLVVLGIFQVILPNIGRSDKFTITIVNENKAINGQLKKTLDQSEYAANGQLKIKYKLINPGEFNSFLESNKNRLIENKNEGIIYLPDSVTSNKKIFFYSSNPSNSYVRDALKEVVNKVTNLNYLKEKNVVSLDLGFIQRDVNIVAVKVTSKGIETESFGPIIIGFTLGVFLLIGSMAMANPIVTTIVEEKVNRVYEVLLSSLKPSEIMAGKIIGTAMTGLTQMTIWILSLILIIFCTQNFFSVPEIFKIKIEAGVYGYFIINYLLGLLIFLTLSAGLSSTLDNHQDSGQIIFLNIVLIQGPFYTIFSLINNPANVVATVLSMMPFTSLYVMPARMALIDVPLWQMLITLLVNIILLCVLIKAAAKIYRIAILYTGRKPSFGELFKWIKYA